MPALPVRLVALIRLCAVEEAGGGAGVAVIVDPVMRLRHIAVLLATDARFATRPRGWLTAPHVPERLERLPHLGGVVEDDVRRPAPGGMRFALLQSLGAEAVTAPVDA